MKVFPGPVSTFGAYLVQHVKHVITELREKPVRKNYRRKTNELGLITSMAVGWEVPYRRDRTWSTKSRRQGWGRAGHCCPWWLVEGTA